jgi:peptidoglycan hydrolase-like protein with peptidoglycan-binding domain
VVLLFSITFKRIIGVLCAVMLCGSLAGAASSSKGKKSSGKVVKSSAKKKTVSSKKRKARGSWRSRGQQAINAERVREIQEALIRENYLNGDVDGEWGERTQTALRRFQEDHGWQAKIVPDSRALIKLGLGPKHENVLNPESLTSNQFSPAALPAAGTAR